MEARNIDEQLKAFPALYFERTTTQERERHAVKLAQVTRESGLMIEPIPNEQGGWDVEIITLDWDEPGLLDKIFEAVLRCTHIRGGISLKRVRIFTGSSEQVVNVLELTDRRGEALGQAQVDQVIAQLNLIHPGERGSLEAIEHTPFTTLIPMVTTFPEVDNTRSDRYTFVDLRVAEISNRFTNVLLHLLARSELWLNIQTADFFQAEEGHYQFWVVDKHGRQLRDSHFTRLSMVRVLEQMNRMILNFNVHYIQRDWEMRLERNERTIYASRPNPQDFMADLANVRQMALLKGLETRLSSLVEHGLLEHKSFYFLKKVESFVEHNKARIQAMVEGGPSEGDADLCREYFDYRRRAVRILMPLFNKLTEMPPVRPLLSNEARLEAVVRPWVAETYELTDRHRLKSTAGMWFEDPVKVLEPFQLQARTDCYLHTRLIDTVEAALEEWTPLFLEKNKKVLGEKFLELIDESIRQGNTPIVLRNMRQVGLLERYLPGFENISGLVHVIADHAYTVDEHTFVLIEVLEGLELLADVLPTTGLSAMRADYEKLETGMGLKRYVGKYTVEQRMLRRVTELRRNETVKPLFQIMDDVRRNSLEYLVEMNFLEQGYALCMDALTEIEKTRKQLDPLIRLYSKLPFSEKRVLVLAGVFHDLLKPDKNHGPMAADQMGETLAKMGLELPVDEAERMTWIVRHHLDIRALMNRMGSEGEEALISFARQAADPMLMRSLVLFTYADRVAVYQDNNKNSHDAMTLSAMISVLDQHFPVE